MRPARIALITVLLITLFLPLAIQPDSIAHADGTEYYAIIIGISNYLYIDDLNYADDDATALYQKLSPILGSDHISLLANSNAGKTAIQNSIQNWLAPREDSDDVVLFYFAGHGGEYLGEYYLAPYDALDYSYANDISASELNNWLSVLDSNNIVVTLDTCDSGGFITALSATSEVIMASSAASESSYDSGGLQHGVFTYYLLQAIDSPNATDTNADYILTTQELFNYASPLVTQWEAQFGNSQHPVYYGNALPFFLIAAISTNVASSALTIDGTQHTISISPTSILLMTSKAHQVTAQSEVTSGTNTRHAFSSWNDGVTTATRTIYQGGQYTANYKTQYYFTVYSAEIETLGGSGWYDVGATASTSTAQDLVTNGNTRYVFQHWRIDGVTTADNPITLSMHSPHTAIADYKTQHYLSVSTEHGSVVGSGWYDHGTTAITDTAQQTITEGSTRYIFEHWDVDNTVKTGNPVTVSMYAPHTATTEYKTQYYLEIQSRYGDISGEGWYDSEAAVYVSAPPVVGTLVRHKFTGWSGSIHDDNTTTSVYMYQPQSILATWKTDYLYLYLLIGGVVVLAAVVIVPITVHIRNNKQRRQIANRRRLQQKRAANG